MGWNNDCSDNCGDTPFMNGMVKSGLRLDQHCAPSDVVLYPACCTCGTEPDYVTHSFSVCCAVIVDAYRFCSPTRSSLLTGRLPIHVNQKNSVSSVLFARAVLQF